MAQLEETTSAPPRGVRPMLRPLALVVLGLGLIFAIIVAGAAYAGYQAGVAERAQLWQATQTAELHYQYQLGVADLAAGRYEVAAARFEYILELDPAYRDAGQQLAAAQAGLAATPTALPQPSPAATATAGPTAATIDSPAVLAQAEAAIAAGDWDEALERLSELRVADPEFEPVKVDGLLYTALRNRGIARIQAGDAMEAGIFDIDQAQAFGPLDSEALNHRAWARLYLAAQSYWNLDWYQSMLILQDLYLIAPYFHDTFPKLYTATINYARERAAAGDYCAAAQYYAEAQALRAEPSLAEQIAANQAACANPPTPDPNATVDPNATPDPNATLDPNATVDPGIPTATPGT